MRYLLGLRAATFLAAAAAGLAALTAEPKVLRPTDVHGRTAQAFVSSFPRYHLERSGVDEAVAAQAFDFFLESLDFAHVFFLQSDVDTFRERVGTLATDLQSGNVSFAFDVYAVFKERVADRLAYVSRLLEQEFTFDPEEVYNWNRRKAPWPADRAAWDDLWTRKTKYEYLQHEVRRTLAEEEAREKAAAVPEEVTPEDEAPDGAPNGEDAGDGMPEGADAGHVEPDPGEAKEAQARAEGAEADDVAPLDGAEGEDAEPEAEPQATRVAPPAPTARESIRKQYEQYLSVLHDYEEDWVLERFLSAFAHAYDPHSDYMSPAAVTDFNIEMRLSLHGIGALLRPNEGAAEVVRLVPGGPAELEGSLKPGDRIIAVGQEGAEPVDVLHRPLSRTVQIIRGAKGSWVTLVVIPAADATGTTTRNIRIQRDEVKLEDQAAKGETRTLETQLGREIAVGVIRLPAFYVDMQAKSSRRDDPDYRSSVRDVLQHVEEMARAGVQGIVLDLRNNGGGSLVEAIEMSGLFIQSGPIVQVKEKVRTSVLRDPDPKVQYTGPMLVLVNRLSASASEILAAALQDYGRAIVVGDQQTHGKGTVQTVVGLDGSGEEGELGSIKVTTASFYRIRGGSTQLKGVTPDIVVPSTFDTAEIGEGALKNPLPWTMVRPVPFAPVANLRPAVRVLREKSEQRRASDERYVRRQELLQRLAELREQNVLRLTPEETLRVARMERSLGDLQRAEADEETGERESVDLVLEESLRIMADFVDFLQTETAARRP